MDKHRGPPYCFDMNGKRISIEEWALTLHGKANRVALAKLPGGVEVSTVLLGLEHGRDRKGRPLIFETMVFTDDRDTYEGRDTLRYATLSEAKRGHAKVVATLRARPGRTAKKLAEQPTPRRVRIIKEE